MSTPYNIRLIEYGNGTFEIRSYEHCINAEFEQDSTIEPIYSKDFKPKEPEKPLTYNPFTEKLEYMPTFEELEYEEIKRIRSEKNSRTRTLQNIYKYSRQCVWEYFITLTFDSGKCDRYSFDDCNSKTKDWFKNQHRRFSMDLKYLYVPELHKDGAYHFHGLIADCGNMKITDSGRVSIGGKAYKRTESNKHMPTIYNLDGWHFGWSTATKVTDTKRVSSYITKYITKDLCSVTKNKRRFYRSRNISEPYETTFVIEGTLEEKELFMQKLVDSLGGICTYKKVVSVDYNTVTYRYYEKE